MKNIKETITKWCKGHKPETIVIIIATCIAAILYWGWSKTSRDYPPTTACIIDSVRHYPPVIRGGNIYVTCKIVNTGDNSLVITDIQPANLSIEQVTSDPKIITSQDTAVVSFVFNTDKIVGYTQQKIRFFGNIKDSGRLTLTFDANVVRPAGDQSDYEDIYFNGEQDYVDLIVDGELGNQGYTTDSIKELKK